MNENEPDLQVWCTDCELVLYAAVVNWITKAVAKDRAYDHAAGLKHEVIIFSNEEKIS